MKSLYEQTPYLNCIMCPYRNSRLAEEEIRNKFGPRSSLDIQIDQEKSCLKDYCVLEEDGRRKSSSSPIFINGIKLGDKRA